MFLNSNCLLAIAAITCEFGCNGVSWPSERVVDSLRVLGVNSEPASATPGQSSHLSLLCADGSQGGTVEPSCNNIEFAWFADCNNPANNDPTKCLNHYSSWIDQYSLPLKISSESLSLTQFKDAPDPAFDFLAPADILQGEIAVSGQSVHYGVSYIFFAACDGNLYPRSGVSDQLPVECRDRNTGAILDQRRFVVGMTTVYSYDIVVNQNPELSDPRVDSESKTPEQTQPCSVDGDCGANWGCARSTTSSATCAPIVAPCTAGNNASCRGHCIDFQVSQPSFHMSTIGGKQIADPVKSLWAESYTNAGSLPDDARLGLPSPTDPSDPTAFVRSSCVPWQAPPYVTEQARVWIVVRDDRGGLTWLEQRVLVRNVPP